MPNTTFREFMASLASKPAEELILRFHFVMADMQILVIQLHNEAFRSLTQARTGQKSEQSVSFSINLAFFTIQKTMKHATVQELEDRLKFIDEQLASPINNAIGALKANTIQDVVTNMQVFDRNYSAYFGGPFDYDKYATQYSIEALPQQITERQTILNDLLSKL